MNAGVNLSDFPSLRDLETSNLFSGVNHNFNIQRHLDQKRLAYLEELRLKFEKNKKSSQDPDPFLTFDEILPPLPKS